MVLNIPSYNQNTKVIENVPVREGVHQALKVINKHRGCILDVLVVEVDHQPIYRTEDVEAKKGLEVMLSFLQEKTGDSYKEFLRKDFVLFEEGIKNWAKSVRQSAKKLLLKQ